MRLEVRLTGHGGQGIILAAIVLAQSAVNNGLEVIQTQAYGPEARGGLCRAEVLISDEKINFHLIEKTDILLCLNKESYQLYKNDIADNGILIVDSYLDIEENPNINIFKIPIIETAIKKINNEIVANVVALGAVVKLIGILSESSVENALISRVPNGCEYINIKALNAGKKLIKNNQRIEEYVSKWKKIRT